MKNLKKVLALVLAFAMAFTMMATAGAAYTDQADIEATEAVDLLNALSVMTGDPDGAFRPNDTITRAEACRMIYTIRNGGAEDASAYANMQTTFTDVPADAWYAGYVKHCQSVGIVSGKSATIFDPNSNVTGVELALMCLRVMGYDPAKADIGGSTWSTKTIGYATEAGLLDGFKAVVTDDCPRQWAAQLMANMLEANTVRWSNDSESYTNRDVVNKLNPDVGAKYMNLAIETGFITKVPNAKKNAKGVEFMYDRNNDGTIENGESVTLKNVATDLSSLMGYEVKVVWNTDKTGDADAVYGIYKTENNVSYQTNWKDIEQNNAKVKFGGKSYDLGAVPAEIKGGAEHFLVYADADWNNPYHDWTSAKFDKKDLADDVTFIDCDGDGKLDAAQIHTQAVTKVTYVGANNITTNGLVGAQNLYNVTYTNSPKLDDVKVYEGIAKDDYAVVSYDVFSDKISYEKAELASGKVEGTRTTSGTKEVKLNGEWMKATDGYTLPTSFATGDTVEYVAVDNLIYHIKKTDGSWGSNSIAMIYKTSAGTGLDSDKVLASIIKRDGTKLNVTVSELDGKAVTATSQLNAVVGLPVTFRVVDGEYEFKTLAADNTAGYAKYGTAGAAYASGKDVYDSKEISDKAVVFVFDNEGDGDYKTGAADVLTGSELKKATGTFNLVGDKDPYLYDTENDFTYVFCMTVAADLDKLTTKGGNYAYLLSDAWEDNIDGKDYRVFDMWTEGGQITAYEESGDTYTYEAGDIIRYEVVSTQDDRTYIKNVSKPKDNTELVAGKVTAVDGNYVGLNGTKYELVNDSVVLNVNTDEKEGISGGAEARAQIAVADTSVTGKSNVLYIVNNSTMEVLFMLIDSANNEIIEGTKMVSPTSELLADALTTAKSGDTVSITGAVPAGNFTVKKGVTLEVPADPTIADTSITVAAGGALKVDEVADTTSSKTLIGTKDARIVTDENTSVKIDFSGSGLAAMTINGNAKIPAGQTWYAMFGPSAGSARGLDMQVTSGTLTVNGELKLIKGSAGSKLTVAAGATVKVGANAKVNVASMASIANSGTFEGTDTTSTLIVAGVQGSATISGMSSVGVSNHTANTYTWSANTWAAAE